MKFNNLKIISLMLLLITLLLVLPFKLEKVSANSTTSCTANRFNNLNVARSCNINNLNTGVAKLLINNQDDEEVVSNLNNDSKLDDDYYQNEEKGLSDDDENNENEQNGISNYNYYFKHQEIYPKDNYVYTEIKTSNKDDINKFVEQGFTYDEQDDFLYKENNLNDINTENIEEDSLIEGLNFYDFSLGFLNDSPTIFTTDSNNANSEEVPLFTNYLGQTSNFVKEINQIQAQMINLIKKFAKANSFGDY